MVKLGNALIWAVSEFELVFGYFHIYHMRFLWKSFTTWEGMAFAWKERVGKASAVYFELQVFISLDECFSRFLLSWSLLFKLDHVLNSKINDSSSHKACQSFVVKLKAQNATLFFFSLARYHHHHKYQLSVPLSLLLPLSFLSLPLSF